MGVVKAARVRARVRPSCRPRGRAPRRCYGSPALPAPRRARTRVSPAGRSARARPPCACWAPAAASCWRGAAFGQGGRRGAQAGALTAGAGRGPPGGDGAGSCARSGSGGGGRGGAASRLRCGAAAPARLLRRALPGSEICDLPCLGGGAAGAPAGPGSCDVPFHLRLRRAGVLVLDEVFSHERLCRLDMGLPP